MPNRIEILEIIRPATQGRSRPFYCRGSDGQHYFVKGRPRSSQGAEWICAHLAMEFGLPIAPFAIVEIDPALLREAQDDWQHLGSGPSFGSCAVSGVSWLERENTDKVSTDTQRDILVFDWWIQNQDRTVFNTNLLWQATEGRLTVIDHNLAFDKEFNPAGFLEGHLFRTQWDTLDLDRRAGYHRRLVDALPALQKACASLPQEWGWYDADQTIVGDLDINRIEAVVTRCESNEFWSLG